MEYETPEKRAVLAAPSFFSDELREELQDVERRRYLYSPPRSRGSSAQP